MKKRIIVKLFFPGLFSSLTVFSLFPTTVIPLLSGIQLTVSYNYYVYKLSRVTIESNPVSLVSKSQLTTMLWIYRKDEINQTIIFLTRVHIDAGRPKTTCFVILEVSIRRMRPIRMRLLFSIFKCKLSTLSLLLSPTISVFVLASLMEVAVFLSFRCVFIYFLL